MPQRLDASAADFGRRFAALCDDRREGPADVRETVSAILADVRARGDLALAELTLKYDRVDLGRVGLRIDTAEIAAARAQCAAGTLAALEVAASRIRAFHEAMRPEDKTLTDALGVRAGVRWGPVEAAGLYAPGGRASYPSSVLMNAIPAKVAGVKRLALCVPAPNGALNPLVLAAAALAGVDEVYRIGGAQAIAALAFGTNSLARVDVIAGPGNAWVAEAKRQVFGVVGIDMIAGPSEILIVADADNDPAAIALDLLSQAEHDPVAQSLLITDSPAFADAVEAAVSDALPGLATQRTAHESWERHGAIILVRDLERDAPALVDALAPEHVELAVAAPESLMARIRHAGSIFLGRHTPEAIGDYLGGPNHVLPTGRRARFASGLSVVDFMKRTTWLDCPPEALDHIGPPAIRLAEAEGLPAHAQSIARRLEGR